MSDPRPPAPPPVPGARTSVPIGSIVLIVAGGDRRPRQPGSARGRRRAPVGLRNPARRRGRLFTAPSERFETTTYGHHLRAHRSRNRSRRPRLFDALANHTTVRLGVSPPAGVACSSASHPSGTSIATSRGWRTPECSTSASQPFSVVVRLHRRRRPRAPTPASERIWVASAAGARAADASLEAPVR